MTTEGLHILADIWLKGPVPVELYSFCESSLWFNGLVIKRTGVHKFDPQGETGFFVLAESHLSYHTYPEHNYISIDCYTCDEKRSSKKVIDDIIKLLGPESVTIRSINRGYIKGITRDV